MKFSVRLKLMGSYVLLMLLMAGAIFLYLNRTLDNLLTGQIRENLVSEARLAASHASLAMGGLSREPSRVAGEIGDKIRARVTLVSRDGSVIGDSQVDQANLAHLENHGDRPEIKVALAGGIGSSIRYSSTLKTDMMYVAAPMTDKPDSAVIRLSLPLADVNAAKKNLHAILGFAFAGSILLSLVLSYLLSQVTSRPLREIAAIAVRIGKGDFSRRLPEGRRDELGELAGVMNEMSERISSQLDKLTAERNRLDAILLGMGEGLMVTDGSGTITLVNPAFRKIFALGEGVTGKRLIDISRCPALHDAFGLVVAGGTPRMEEINLASPDERTLLTHWVPLQEAGVTRGVVAVFHDISDLKRLEKIRRDFVANVSHELRTPVTVIRGYAETLLEGALEENPAQARRFLEIILAHSERLANLIGDLLTLSELESGGLRIEQAPCSLNPLFQHLATLLEAKAAAKGITIHLPEQPLPQVMADSGRLEQVMVNLLDNPIKYTPDGGKVVIDSVDEGKILRVSVKDNGVGIPPADLSRIFERFYRVDAARSRKEGGTGLGLSIVKHIVQLHGGTISVESEPGQGATFSFTLRKT